MIAKFNIMKTTIATIATIFLVGSIIPFVNAEGVPAWVKNNASWWADGTITDTEFINGIQHLIKTGVISLPTSESKFPESTPKTTSDGSRLVELQADLDKCKDIFQSYARYDCVDKAKLKITEYEYEQKSTPYVVGSAIYYFPGPEFEISPTGQALLTIKMLVKNTSSTDNLSLFCTGPAICNYDVWDGQNAFRYSATDFTNGNIVLTPGKVREFSMLFGPMIPIPGGTKFIYDPAKDYVFRISEPWGSATIPLNLP